MCLPDPSSGYCKVERDEWRQRGALRWGWKAHTHPYLNPCHWQIRAGERSMLVHLRHCLAQRWTWSCLIQVSTCSTGDHLGNRPCALWRLFLPAKASHSRKPMVTTDLLIPRRLQQHRHLQKYLRVFKAFLSPEPLRGAYAVSKPTVKHERVKKEARWTTICDNQVTLSNKIEGIRYVCTDFNSWKTVQDSVWYP